VRVVRSDLPTRRAHRSRNLRGYISVSGTSAAAEGITNPPIDELLTKTDSKYRLVLYSAKRARQINAYYSQLGEGLLEYVGPLVDTHVQEKPLSIALREINDDLLTCEEFDPDAEPESAIPAAEVMTAEDLEL
jgi:DNA-directed RNA polymerase subunit omega